MKFVFASVFTLFSLTVAAEESTTSVGLKSEQKIKHRRAAFTLMSPYFSRILHVVEGEVDYDRRDLTERQDGRDVGQAAVERVCARHRVWPDARQTRYLA